MFVRHTSQVTGPVVSQLRSWLARLVPAELSGPESVRLLDFFLTVEKLAAAGAARVATRAVATNQWRADGSRSPEHWLARRAGCSVGVARDALETARRLDELPASDAAVRNGSLSAAQANVITDAATADPSAEEELLAAAGRESLTELRRRAERIKAAARSADDEAARHEAVHRSRFLRKSVGADGAHRLHARGTAEDIARFWSRLQPFVDEQFRAARAAGRREAGEAYAFDALLAMSETGGSAKSPTKMIVRVDLPALRRGTTGPGEVCEIAGYGPIPVTTARGVMNEAFLALVCTKGKDVVNVTHLGRQFTEHQKTALEWSDPECQTLGCSSTVRLERDHRDDWASTHKTRITSADRLCHFHHTLKTAGWRLEPGTGKRQLLPPPEREPAFAGHDPP